jgi:CRISPR system Cascade subunit CasB
MDDTGDVRGALFRLALAIVRLEPGQLAALRRATPGEGTPEFWRLWHSAEWPGRAENWEWVAAAFAIVTPTGRPEDKRTPHQSDLPFGRALQAAGISELRVARVLNAPFDQRRPLLIRLCRTLAAKDQTMDMRDLGELLLRPHAPLRKLADTYYAALAAADRKERTE